MTNAAAGGSFHWEVPVDGDHRFHTSLRCSPTRTAKDSAKSGKCRRACIGSSAVTKRTASNAGRRGRVLPNNATIETPRATR